MRSDQFGGKARGWEKSRVLSDYQIDTIFQWIENDCELRFEQLKDKIQKEMNMTVAE